MYGEDFTIAKVKRLSNVLKENGLYGKQIDIFKMDIEGAEIEVLESMIEDGILPKILCVEFDYYLKGCDKNGRTSAIIKKLKGLGYELIHNKSYNMTYRIV